MGAWIEISNKSSFGGASKVAPRMGAWVETWARMASRSSAIRRALYGCVGRNNGELGHTMSHPIWVCGSKLVVRGSKFCPHHTARRTLHGCVDRNPLPAFPEISRIGRTLHGCVDRNVLAHHKSHFVVPHMGSWVENR